jgi:hypothetical protein
MALPVNSGPRPLIQFRNHFSQPIGLLGRMISSSQGRDLHTGQHKHRINACTHQTSMPWVGFEPTFQASERAKTVHALDRAATVTGGLLTTIFIVLCNVGVYLISSDHQLYRVTPLKTPFGLLIPFITIPITSNYIHSQLFLTLLRVLHNYNPPCSLLKSLIPFLHVYTV